MSEWDITILRYQLNPPSYFVWHSQHCVFVMDVFISCGQSVVTSVHFLENHAWRLLDYRGRLWGFASDSDYSVDSSWPNQWWKIICYTPGLSLRRYLPWRALYRDESWTDKNFYIRESNPPISRREEYLTRILRKRKSNLVRKERFE